MSSAGCHYTKAEADQDDIRKKECKSNLKWRKSMTPIFVCPPLHQIGTYLQWTFESHPSCESWFMQCFNCTLSHFFSTSLQEFLVFPLRFFIHKLKMNINSGGIKTHICNMIGVPNTLLLCKGSQAKYWFNLH